MLDECLIIDVGLQSLSNRPNPNPTSLLISLKHSGALLQKLQAPGFHLRSIRLGSFDREMPSYSNSEHETESFNISLWTRPKCVTGSLKHLEVLGDGAR